jgi:hypothetical protein
MVVELARPVTGNFNLETGEAGHYLDEVETDFVLVLENRIILVKSCFDSYVKESFLY